MSSVVDGIVDRVGVTVGGFSVFEGNFSEKVVCTVLLGRVDVVFSIVDRVVDSIVEFVCGGTYVGSVFIVVDRVVDEVGGGGGGSFVGVTVLAVVDDVVDEVEGGGGGGLEVVIIFVFEVVDIVVD